MPGVTSRGNTVQGSFLARLGALTVRVIDAEIGIATSREGSAPATTGC